MKVRFGLASFFQLFSFSRKRCDHNAVWRFGREFLVLLLSNLFSLHSDGRRPVFDQPAPVHRRAAQSRSPFWSPESELGALHCVPRSNFKLKFRMPNLKSMNFLTSNCELALSLSLSLFKRFFTSFTTTKKPIKVLIIYN